MTVEEILDRLAPVVPTAPGLELLVLHGSRARGTARPDSDHDLGYLAGPGFRVEEFVVVLSAILGTEAVDLVDLDRSSGLLRFRAARDGVVLHERATGRFRDFRLEAIGFWCEVEPILERGYERILARLDA